MDKTREEMELIIAVRAEVRKRIHATVAMGWIAKQAVTEHQPYDDLYCFIIGNGAATVRVADALHADDALYNELATQIMGYAPGSEEDLTRRRDEAGRKMVEAMEEGERMQANFAIWRNLYYELDAKLYPAKMSYPAKIEQEKPSTGLRLKYNVFRVSDGAPVRDFFVLEPLKDIAARAALMVYALAVQVDNPELCRDLMRWLEEMPPLPEHAEKE